MPEFVRGKPIVAWAVLVSAVAWFVFRGVWRWGIDRPDIAVRYHAAQEWLAGRDPYAFADGYGLSPVSVHIDPPTTLLAFTPLTLLSWPDARMVATLVSAAAAVVIAVGVLRLVEWPWRSPKALLLLAFLIAFGPAINTLAVGQTGLVATAAIIVAMLLERSGRRTASGAMFGLATVLKATLGLPFIAYLLWRRRWSPAIAALVVVSIPMIISVAGMQVAGAPWLETWQANLQATSGPGGFNDPDPQNEARLGLVNLHYPLALLLPEGELANVVAIAAVGVIALAFVWLRRGRDAHPDLLTLAMVSVLTLLVTYHRYYDAVLLVIPMAWAASALSGPSARSGFVVLLLCGGFLLPVQNLILPWFLSRTELIPTVVTSNPIWNAGVLAQNTWMLVAMGVVLLLEADRERRYRPAVGGLEQLPGGIG